MNIRTVKTGSVRVSPAIPNKNAHQFKYAYTGLFQFRSNRIVVPVKCFYVTVVNHHILIDAGWSLEVIEHPIKHLGFGIWFSSEPIMKSEEAAINQLKDVPIDGIYMTHLDCDHASGLKDFNNVPLYVSKEEYDYSQSNRIRYGSFADYTYSYFEFKDDPLAPFNKSMDIFGDNTVIAYLTPTHSAGSVIYRINDIENNKFALIIGDNGYNEDSWKKGFLPGLLYNEENAKLCLNWIKEQSEKENCLGIYAAHDPIDR